MHAPARLSIGLDSRNLGATGGTGVATYARSVERALRKTGHTVAHLNAGTAPPGLGRWFSRHHAALRGVRRARQREDGDLYCQEVNAAAHIRFGLGGGLTRVHTDTPLSAMHLTYPLPFVVEGCVNLVTIHDIIPCLQPELSPVSGARIEALLRALLGEKTILLAVSEAARRDILSFFQVAPERVINLSQPVSFTKADLDAAATASSPVPPESFLFFGSLERRKNICRLVQAHGRSGTHRPLALIGAEGFGIDAYHRAVEAHPRPELVIRVPWCTRPALIKAIREARAVTFPSLGEGFGLPIVEAMALGTPVMTSHGGATEEVAGGAAQLVDPYDVEMMAEVIAELDRDDELHAALSSRGLRQAKTFSQAAFAERLSALHADIQAGERVLTS